MKKDIRFDIDVDKYISVDGQFTSKVLGERGLYHNFSVSKRHRVDVCKSFHMR